MTPPKSSPWPKNSASACRRPGRGHPPLTAGAGIDGWVAEAGGVADHRALEALVARKLQMVFEEIRTDGDFDRITDKYARAKRDPVFATMRMRFDDADNPTYGALVRRKNAGADAPDRFVAVIDCRGGKLARRFFTRWHEIAHRLTTHADRARRSRPTAPSTTPSSG